MQRKDLMIGLGLLSASVLVPAIAKADPPWERRWRKHGYCCAYAYPGPAYVVRPPVYYAPPPVVYVPPPPVVYAPPTYVAPAPGLSIGVNIPLR